MPGQLAILLACLAFGPAGGAQETDPANDQQPALSSAASTGARLGTVLPGKKKSREQTPLLRRRAARLPLSRRLLNASEPRGRELLPETHRIDDCLTIVTTVPGQARADWQQRLMDSLLDRTRA